jgi:hypothetical protein
MTLDMYRLEPIRSAGQSPDTAVAVPYRLMATSDVQDGLAFDGA